MVPVEFWCSRHFCLTRRAFLKSRITLGFVFCLKTFSLHFSVLPVVKLSLFFFCNWNEEQSRINTPDSHSVTFYCCCEPNARLCTRHVQHFLGNNRQQLGISQASFHPKSSGCMSWVNSSQSFSPHAVLGSWIINSLLLFEDISEFRHFLFS